MVSLPHPEKKQGEDSAFCTPTALGVADGVGGWARKGTYPSAVQAMAFMATTVGDVAHDVAKSHTRLTPFALAARQAGYKDTAGGKMDDITVVAALVQEE
ncbi:hypothetical protein DYB36_006428 [Aphanomyces astaci]|uniref:Protein phosphatase n=1 Tax=Aphanomyces astaci TaxID=112090 RepID=A0A397AIP1_APHAT|nr:hypothetical protein DYB36_006428 [Aphanomyces astaci]